MDASACNYNSEATIDGDDPATADINEACWSPNDGCTCSDAQGSESDCEGVCNGSAIVDCAGECGGSSELDVCGICGGSGTDSCGQCVLEVTACMDIQEFRLN